MIIAAMIPARMGSQRLPKKNLALLDGEPLIVHAIRKCQAAGVFDDIFVNSEHVGFGSIAEVEGAKFHQRPEHLGSNTATSEDFISEFLETHPCDFVVQVHSIAPLLSASEVRDFVTELRSDRYDGLMSVVEENLECLYRGKPVNFSFAEKTNSQNLIPVERIVWAITGWRREAFLTARQVGTCATWSGRIGTYPVSRLAGHVIKTQGDLDIANALYPALVQP